MNKPGCDRAARFGLALFFLLLSGIGMSAPLKSDVETIKGAYDRACVAAELKFLDGMVGHRASWFEAVGADGRKMDLVQESFRLRRLLSKALTVKERTTAKDFQQKDGGLLECRVSDHLEVTLARGAELELITIVVKTESIDHWQKTELGWRQVRSHLISQTWTEPGASDVP